MHALAFIFITILIDTIGFGIILPVTPQLIMHLTGQDLSSASTYGGWLAVAYAGMQFFAGPLIGSLSDRFGRRPVLLLSLFAFGVDYLIMGLAPSIGWLFLGRILAGMAGAAYTTANAYVADISAPEKRAQNFGLIGAAFGVGFILGPAIGGLVGGLGPRVPFYTAAGLGFLNLIYGWFVLPESLPVTARRPFSWKRAHLLGALAHIRQYPGVLALLGALFLWQLGHQALPSIWAFYTMFRFGWSERAVGYSLAFAGITMAVVQGGLTRSLVPKLGERRAAIVGLGFGVLGFLAYGLAPVGWGMYAAMMVGALAGLVYPSFNALMSARVPATAQGELQGAVASTYSLTSIVGPLLMTQLFHWFTRPNAPVQLPGAPFLAAALLGLAAATMMGVAIRSDRRSQDGRPNP